MKICDIKINEYYYFFVDKKIGLIKTIKKDSNGMFIIKHIIQHKYALGWKFLCDSSSPLNILKKLDKKQVKMIKVLYDI